MTPAVAVVTAAVWLAQLAFFVVVIGEIAAVWLLPTWYAARWGRERVEHGLPDVPDPSRFSGTRKDAGPVQYRWDSEARVVVFGRRLRATGIGRGVAVGIVRFEAEGTWVGLPALALGSAGMAWVLGKIIAYNAASTLDVLLPALADALRSELDASPTREG